MRKPRRVNTRAQIYILTLTAITLCLVSLGVNLAVSPLPLRRCNPRASEVPHSSACLLPVNNSDGRV